MLRVGDDEAGGSTEPVEFSLLTDPRVSTLDWPTSRPSSSWLSTIQAKLNEVAGPR